jgi:hypothetical protein
VYEFLISPMMRATCPTYLILLNFITSTNMFYIKK